MGDCCSKPKTAEKKCHHETQTSQGGGGCCEKKTGIDYWLWGPIVLVVLLYHYHLLGVDWHWSLHHLSDAVYELMNTMAIGLIIGVCMVAVLSYVPRELVMSAMGRSGGFGGLVRATVAGVLLDLCSHGILMVGAKLYERGVSTGQVMAFLIASPWNSLSLTVILIALIGLGWTLSFIALSMVVGLLTGYIFDILVAKKVLPSNPNTIELPESYDAWNEFKQHFSGIKFTKQNILHFITTGITESKMVIRWLLIGVILASLIRTFVPEDYFSTYLGPTILGLSITIFVATVVEVCSEGSTPIAADIFNRASAPGNSFAFLMAGVSTDYTEVMVIRERMKSWKIALFLPLISLPQIVLLAFILNNF